MPNRAFARFFFFLVLRYFNILIYKLVQKIIINDEFSLNKYNYFIFVILIRVDKYSSWFSYNHLPLKSCTGLLRLTSRDTMAKIQIKEERGEYVTLRFVCLSLLNWIRPLLSWYKWLFKPTLRTGYIICRTQCKIKIQGPVFKIIKNFKELTAEHWTKHGPFWP